VSTAPPTHPPRSDSAWQRLDAVVFTADQRQRMRLQQTLLAVVLMVLSVAIVVYAARVAGTPPAWVAAWTMLSLGGMAAMWLAIRSGWSRRFEDPSLTLAQMLFAITSGAVAYTLAGPVRGATFPVLMVILAFGMFQMRAGMVAMVSLYALLAFGAVMAWMASTAPQVYTPSVEWGHFAMLAAMLPALSMLASRLARLRSRERRQRHELTQAVSRIQELATRDELTGLVNRRHMAALIELERQRGARSGRMFALAIVDIDHFKAVNDHYGHGVGDEVMRNLARQMPQALRGTDIVARWGGEEFVVLLPESTLSTARVGLERLRGRIAATPMAHLTGVPIRITLSAGLTEHIAGESVQQTLERADKALYEAKSKGRNRTMVA
jgi:diguanylate cyclase (GGDEF)-like protein